MVAPVLPILLFVAVTLALAALLVLVGYWFNPSRPGQVKEMPYESGMDPSHSARRRFDIRFHLVAIAFLVFDVELLFLYPWAVAARGNRCQVGTTGHAVAAVFASPNSAEEACRLAGVRSVNPIATTSEGGGDTRTGERLSTRAPAGIDTAVQRGWVADRHLVFCGVATFFLLLVVGLVYDWRKGIFRWR